MSRLKKKQTFILAQFPITANGKILFNIKAESKAEGLKKAERKFGPFKRIKVAEMDGVQTEDNNRYMIIFGQPEVDMLAKWLVDGLDEAGLIP